MEINDIEGLEELGLQGVLPCLASCDIAGGQEEEDICAVLRYYVLKENGVLDDGDYGF